MGICAEAKIDISLRVNAANVVKATALPPANLFSAKKFGWGEISEKGKGGDWWGAPSSAGQAARLRITLLY